MKHIDILIMDQQVSSAKERSKVLKRNNYTVAYDRRSAIRLSITDITPEKPSPKTPPPSITREESTDSKTEKPKEKQKKMPKCCGCIIS